LEKDSEIRRKGFEVHSMIYMDYAATSPLAPGVLDAMLPYLSDRFGNPSSLYSVGREARRAVESARQKVASAIGAQPDEIIFTGSGTEADNWAVFGALSLFAKNRAGRIPHIVLSPIEHHAILHAVRASEKTYGTETHTLPVCADGRVDPAAMPALLHPSTALVTVIAASNEIGTLQPLEELGAVLRGTDVLFHTDAVQAVGHIPVDVNRWNVDLLSLAAHKFGGPKGVGALYVRKGIALPSFMHGGAQESNRRAGTENTAGIVGMGAAVELAVRELNAESDRLCALRDKLVAGVLRSIPRARLTGHPAARLPGTASFAFDCVEGEALVLRLDALGVCVSSGSACASGTGEPSHVLTALGLPRSYAYGSLRCTLGHASAEGDVDALIAALPGVVAKLRKDSPLWVE
jgi:cysteine desulfurase